MNDWEYEMSWIEEEWKSWGDEIWETGEPQRKPPNIQVLLRPEFDTPAV